MSTDGLRPSSQHRDSTSDIASLQHMYVKLVTFPLHKPRRSQPTWFSI